ncbi:SAV_2336 N-terminal domain-related protein [Streptomyces sp. 6N223]|uniref:SAV_2336 N-terminal domain-related protein n=1 Tax=Streptomyces sp. 6N223 TaxID=3457412 RepID=UPI003FD4FD86
MSGSAGAADAAGPRRPDQPAATDGLPGLIRALRGAGLDPDWAGLADALWLAQFSRPPAGPDAAAGPGRAAGRDGDAPPADARAEPSGRTGRRATPAGGAADAEERTGAEGTRPGRAPRPGDETVALYADPAGSGDALPQTLAGPGGAPMALPDDALRVGVPEARALPGLLELERALRPLQRYRPPTRPPRGSHGRLDERATVERTARAGGLLLPAFHEVERGHVELQLLMDAAPAMRVWQRMLAELTEVFARLGAFRDIQVHYLHSSPDGTPAIARRFERGEPREGERGDGPGVDGGAALRPVRQLIDPTGRRLTVVVSDCAGPLWRSGAAHRLLARLARHAQVAVVQPLPQRLWSRTRLPVSHGTLLREEGPAGSARLRFDAADPRRPAAGPGGAVPVPVLPPTAAALGAWAGLLAGPGSGSVRAAVGWARPDQPPAAPARHHRAPARSAAEQLARFRATASPGAVRLAEYLSAAPLFLPVMQLIQRTMLPDSGPAELSEVLLSGLLRRRESTDGRWYEFAEGVHDELLAALGQDEALLVLKHCSGYVERRFGKAGPNFPALALAQLTGGQQGTPPPPGRDAGPHPAPGPDAGSEPDADAGRRTGAGADADAGRARRRRSALQPFAEVAAKVLRRFLAELPPPVRSAPDAPGADRDALPAEEAVARARALAARFETDGRVRHLMAAAGLLREATSARRVLGHGADRELWSELAELLLRLWEAQREAELLREARQTAEVAAAPPGSVRSRTVLARVLTAQAGERRAGGDPKGALELWRLADREFAAVCATPGLGAREALGPALERVRVLEKQWLLGGDAGLLQESVGMLEAIADAWPEGRPIPSGLPLAHGRALLRLAGAEPDAERARVNAEQAAASLALGCQALLAESAPPAVAVRAMLDQVDALLLTQRDWQRASEVIAEARELADEAELDSELYGTCLVRAGRWHARRFAEESDPADLVEAAQRFAGASRLVPRDRPEYGELLEEWGAVLLRRAQLALGEPFIAQAVRVLRDCRMETPAGDPRLPERLLLLGRALAARYRQARDLVDLREAEHLFTGAARGARDPMTRAWAWFELGETHHRAHTHTQRPERLELAAEAYRQAAAAAEEAGQATPDPAETLRLAASALHQRGVVYQAARRPLAAEDSYRAAQDRWRRLAEAGAGAGTATGADGDDSDDGEEPGRETAARLAELRRDQP